MPLAQEKTPRFRVLAEDFFKESNCGWTQLVGSQYPHGPVMHDQEYGYGDGGGTLVLECGDGAKAATDNRTECMAAKRMWRGSSQHIGGYVDMQWVWYWGSQYNTTSPHYVQFGLDCASPTDNPRMFFQIRWLNYDPTTTSRVTEYQVNTGTSDSPTWTNIPTASWQASAGTGDASSNVYPHGWNENKRDWHMVRARFDVQNAQYVGMMIDGDPHGIYTGVSADETAWRALGPTTETLDTFQNGFNGWFAIGNNSANPINNHCWAGLGYFRAETGWDL